MLLCGFVCVDGVGDFVLVWVEYFVFFYWYCVVVDQFGVQDWQQVIGIGFIDYEGQVEVVG